MSHSPTSMPSVTPYLTMVDCAKAMEFYKNVFGATETFSLALPDGKVCHAELSFNGSPIMVGEEHPGMSTSPTTLKGTPVRICLMVEDVDGLIEKAVKAGAIVVMPPEDCFYGHRSGAVRDPFGHEWMLNHEFEKVPHEEMKRRFSEMVSKAKA